MEKADIIKLNKACKYIDQKILSFRNNQGVWDGKLSSSALSTAVSTFALYKSDAQKYQSQIKKGLNWLNDNVNPDGGFGDTVKSSSNLSTSLLCWSTLSIVQEDPAYKHLIKGLEFYLLQTLPSLNPESISKAILDHYKTDKTFSVPILAMCAMAGRLGTDGWNLVPQLPFQLAAFPDKYLKFLNLSVVSYAVPALIAIGLVKYKNTPSKSFIKKLTYEWSIPKVLKVLSEKQPDNGGFLEASPLTSFVLMSLIESGYKNHPVCERAINFLQDSIREDGSYPIDTNLTTWITSLSINGLSNKCLEELPIEKSSQIYNWYLDQQHLKIHPFTKSEPGGWAWINTLGGVPDGDDTSGALLALHRLSNSIEVDKNRVQKGIMWLINNQNQDGGFPTFCKGWGKLPFDASCADITAHAIRAMVTWQPEFDQAFSRKINNSINKALKYLKHKQRHDGSWLPLWFGNENDSNHQNPVYGTSQVLIGLLSVQHGNFSHLGNMISKGIQFLHQVQNNDGGWGGNKNIRSSFEETALSTRALAIHNVSDPMVRHGVSWLNKNLDIFKENTLPAAPIGLYFASLWYFEDMYPWVYTAAALHEVKKQILNKNINPN